MQAIVPPPSETGVRKSKQKVPEGHEIRVQQKNIRPVAVGPCLILAAQVSVILQCFSTVHSEPLRIAALMRIRRPGSDLRTLPFVDTRWVLITQKGRPKACNRGSESQWARQRVAVIAPKLPSRQVVAWTV